MESTARPPMGLQETLSNIREFWPDTVSPMSTCVLAVQRFAALLQANAHAALVPHGLTFVEFEVLAALRASPPPRELLPSQLYDALMISSGGLTKVLKSLEARGCIARPHRSGDRRRRPILLTAKGRALAERAVAAIQRADALKLGASGLTDADYERLAKLVARALPEFENAD